MVFKCKMCGGTIEFEKGDPVGVCIYCGTKQTLPKTDDEVIANLFNRANNLRLKCEFDRAERIYENIVQQDDSEAEAHWGIILCKYGIEYVEDPKTFQRIPTCHRTLFDAVTADPDYQAAIDYSDATQQAMYESEARAIDRIQKDILAIVENEKPFDVFLCYKETDENGKRTIDSTMANDIYYQLTQEGYKVFYAAITLEDKLGKEYEPYIFAALNSAKVMLVIGTKPEYFNAVWVKNEWSRFLKLMKTDRSKMLIPCYRDMDAYDMPEEFAHLQAQDMSKIGFINDVVRGIKKIIVKEDTRQASKPAGLYQSSATTASLLERTFLFLEDGKWEDASTYCEKVLDIDPKNAEAYLAKLMAELQICERKQLADCAEPFDYSDNFSKVLRFGDEALVTEVRGYVDYINERNENARLTDGYNSAKNAMDAANTDKEYVAAADLFAKIPGYLDADELRRQCLELAETYCKDSIYNSAKSLMVGESVLGYSNALKNFKKISGWKDVDQQISACQKKIEEIRSKEEKERLRLETLNRSRIIAIDITIVVIIMCFVLAFIWQPIIEPALKNAKLNSQRLKPGDSVYFGAYEQDNNMANGKEDIEWIVLEKDNENFLLISKYALSCQWYDSTDTAGTTWETCGLRAWLNQTFINEAFSPKEQAKINTSDVSVENGKGYSLSNPSNKVTEDKVFLLSIEETEKYFTTDESRKCAPTTYLKTRGAFTSNKITTEAGEDTCWWWLRSPGERDNTAAYVSFEGSIDTDGNYNKNDGCAVRPVLWINLSKK